MLAHARWFSTGTPSSSTTKTGRHDIAEILLKVALNTINQIKSDQKERPMSTKHSKKKREKKRVLQTKTKNPKTKITESIKKCDFIGRHSNTVFLIGQFEFYKNAEHELCNYSVFKKRKLIF